MTDFTVIKTGDPRWNPHERLTVNGYRIGMRVGRLVLAETNVGRDRHGHQLSRWLCDCGNEKIIAPFLVRKGRTTTCGCRKREGNPKHRMRYSKTYATWRAMKNRCHNPNTPAFQTYGAAGITVCDRWRTSFDAFLADMGERPAGMTIDRIDGAKGYEPGNCRWATSIEQARNTKRNVRIEIDGRTELLTDWAKIVGLRDQIIIKRMKRGWPGPKAVMTPLPSNHINPGGDHEVEPTPTNAGKAAGAVQADGAALDRRSVEGEGN